MPLRNLLRNGATGMTRKRSRLAGEEGNYLASVSDLMFALMFVFIITLSVFVLSFQQRTEELAGADEARQALLIEIQQALEAEGETRISVDAENGLIRFGEAILFPSGSAQVTDDGAMAITLLKAVLERVLPCYSQSRTERECGMAGDSGTVDAVFIEGHTDRVPIGNEAFEDNWDLSATRARRVYQLLVPEGEALDELRNVNMESMFTVSGYADRRPVDPDDLEVNRRIDLRFVMVPPSERPNPPAAETAAGMGQ